MYFIFGFVKDELGFSYSVRIGYGSFFLEGRNEEWKRKNKYYDYFYYK